MKEAIDVVFSFDTTGSMYPCLTQVRRSIDKTVQELMKEIPNIRIGVIAHGDYCDKDDPYVIKMLDLTTKKNEICKFIRTVKPTFGGDWPECYELVLHEARRLTWSAGKSKVFVMIGDAVPHPSSYPDNDMNLDWMNELGLLTEAGVYTYAVHCLDYGDRDAVHFWETLGSQPGGFYLKLDQFSRMTQLIKAVCYKQVGYDRLQQYADHITKEGRMDRTTANMFSTLMGGASRGSEFVATHYGDVSLDAVNPARFQVLEVLGDVDIREFCASEGLQFKKGRGFYEFTKSVTVQEEKEVILMHKHTGDMFSGNKAREMIGLPYGERGRIKPSDGDLCDYTAFIQSTSPNRKLIGGTDFLYEVEAWR